MGKRITPAVSGPGPELEEDALYRGVLVSAVIEPSKNPRYPDDQLRVEWELNQGGKLRDYLALKLGEGPAGVSKLRQLLNALAEKPKDAELWFDAETLEWGYDLDGEDSTPAYAVLTAGMVVNLKGEMRAGRDGGKFAKITGYRAFLNGKMKDRVVYGTSQGLGPEKDK